ncbi:unnamed protein product [Danaus chrysippus]|uniref:(African queen) hypothetical protein n=1 Tax=Danaus chrysippus TaxID=151541 RepID=A0A8J2W049_9NEOP|nr:unnamed protein product [Danaus chrysippus]
MSQTPSKNVDSLNYFIPKELPTVNKEGSPVSKTVYMHLSKLHSFLNDWLRLKEKGVKICKTISALKLYECVDDYYPHQTQPLIEGLLESLSGFENIVEGVKIINNQLQALSQLQSTPDAVINTWSCTEIAETVSNITHNLEKELKLKKVITENVAHCRDECLIEVYVSAWEFEAYFNMDTCAYLFAGIGLTGIT